MHCLNGFPMQILCILLNTSYWVPGMYFLKIDAVLQSPRISLCKLSPSLGEWYRYALFQRLLQLVVGNAWACSLFEEH